jgi:hypothetical protein
VCEKGIVIYSPSSETKERNVATTININIMISPAHEKQQLREQTS